MDAMPVKTVFLNVKSGPDMDIIDITGKVADAVAASGLKDGVVSVFVPGSTGSVSTMEYEPNLKQDIVRAIERIAPSGMEYEHHKTWGDRNGKSHVRATLLGPGTVVPFKDGKLMLGTWQQIVLMDFDVPARSREVVVQIVGE